MEHCIVSMLFDPSVKPVKCQTPRFQIRANFITLSTSNFTVLRSEQLFNRTPGCGGDGSRRHVTSARNVAVATL